MQTGKFMDIVDSRQEIKNSKLLWLILGILLIPVFNSVDSLVGGLFKIVGFSIMARVMLSTILQAFITLGLLAILFWIIRKWNIESPPWTVLTLKTFKTYGFIFLIIIVTGRVISFFVLKNIDNEIELIEESERYDVLRDSTYWHLASAIFSVVREILIFSIYFVVVLKNKSTSLHYRQQRI